MRQCSVNPSPYPTNDIISYLSYFVKLAISIDYIPFIEGFYMVLCTLCMIITLFLLREGVVEMHYECIYA